MVLVSDLSDGRNKDKRIAELEAELKVWKPDTASLGHSCPGCGREYNLETDLHARIAELEAELYRKNKRLEKWIACAKEYEQRIEELEGALREIGSGAYNDEWSADLARQALGEDKNE